MEISKINNQLKEFISENREQLFQNKIKERAEYITIVLEDLYQKHNSSAVLRSCDCFGIQNVHIIENKNTFQTSKEVDMGSSKWLSINQHNSNQDNTTNTIIKLKEQGYRIIATTPHSNDVALEDFDLTKGKTALLFGTELTGLSDKAMNLADEFLKIPMYGFTESLNISVSAAIILHFLSLKLRNSNINWKLNNIRKQEVLFEWYNSSIKDSNKIIEKILLNF